MTGPKRSRKATHLSSNSLQDQQRALWKRVQQYHTTAIAYNQKCEWIAGYYNMQLCVLACKHYANALGVDPPKATTSTAVRTSSATPYTLRDPPPVHADDPHTTLHHLCALLPLYQKKLRAFQRAFGCPRAPPNQKKTTDTTDCAAVAPVDLDKENAPIYFDDLIGNQQAKEAVEDGLMNPMFLPMLYPNQAKAVLFYGPPGTGKTLLARATAFELNRRESLRVLFFAPTADQFKGKFVGETEEKIVRLFQCASRHAEELQSQLHAQRKTQHIRVKSVVFIDEVDSLARRRDGQTGASAGIVASATNTLLQVMDGIQSYDNVVVLAATNYPWNIDSAILRRFGQKVYVPLPSEDDIVELLQQSVVQQVKRSLQVTKESHKRSIKEQFARWQLLHGVQEKELRVLASEMVGGGKDVGYSPRDLVRLCESVYKRAASEALHRGTFHRIHLRPNRHAHPIHTQMFEEMLQSLSGTHVSTKTYQRLCAYMPHAIDTTVPPTSSHDSTFPKTITHTAIADGAGAPSTYTEWSVLSKSKQTFALDTTLSHTMHVYLRTSPEVPTGGPLGILLHRTFKVHARNQTHYVPFFVCGHVPSAQATKGPLSAKAVFPHLSHMVFVYDGRLYKVQGGKRLFLQESLWSKEQTATIVIDTSDSWLRQCVDGLVSFVPSSPRTKHTALAAPQPTRSPTTPPSAPTPATTPKVPTVAKLLAQQAVRMSSARGIKDITPSERFEYNTHKAPTHQATTSRPMKCVHTTYTIQSFVDAYSEILPSAKIENVRALEMYHRTGKEP